MRAFFRGVAALETKLPLGVAMGMAVASSQRSSTESEDPSHFSTLPEKLKQHRFETGVAYGCWDTNWDYCQPSRTEVAKLVGLNRPALTREELELATRALYAEPGSAQKTSAQVDKLIERSSDLEEVFMRALYSVRGTRRHLILVRHGQYEEKPRCDEQRVLTPLGRQQAVVTGQRIAEMLRPVLQTPGRVVTIHTSTMQRAKETADIIAAQLPSESVVRRPPNPLLVEGSPPAHNIPGPLYSPRDVHTSLMESAFRSLFYRLPLTSVALSDAADTSDLASASPREHFDEYEVVVCHANVIRFMALRALQLPAEAWFRTHPKNCSLTHLRVRPSGEVDLFSLGDAGHLSVAENTFGMSSRYPFK